MIYISLDIETTGVDPRANDIIEIGALIEDTDNPLPRNELPTFHCYIWKETYRANAWAMAMHSNIFKKILELKKIETPEYLKANNPQFLLTPEEVWPAFESWTYTNRSLLGNKKLVVAGKNVAGFDIPFLAELPGRMPQFSHRVIDPGMMYFNPRIDDVPPDLKTCKIRANLPDVVSHEALDDAWDVIKLVRNKFPLI